LIRFKLKYRFWGCVPESVQVCTRQGWQYHHDLSIGDEILALNPDTQEIRWEPLEKVTVYDYDGDLRKWNGHIDALSTPNHRWLVEGPSGRYIARSSETVGGDPSMADVPPWHSVVVGGGAPTQFATQAKYDDEFVEAVAWVICDGSIHTNKTGSVSIHLAGKKPHKVAAWRRLSTWARQEFGNRKPWSEGMPRANGQSTFYIGTQLTAAILDVAPNKRITAEFINSLTYYQAKLFHDTLIAADGHRRGNSVRWTQVDDERRAMFQWLAALLGIRSTVESGLKVQEYYRPTITAGTVESNASDVHYEGQVWCPTVKSGIWFARSESGSTYWTGNTSVDGTRQVMTYVEVMDEDSISEYLNDELIDSRPNPLGVIPVVHIPNIPVPGSPWGLSDGHDIISLNRSYNEISTDVADIIAYHAAPVTVITGAKASNLEKGPRKIWGGLPKDARVENLEGGAEGLVGAMQFLESIKRAMHELMGIPETALGQVQPISNTSGVALSILYQPLMNRATQKVAQYGRGLERINELILLHLALYERGKDYDVFAYDPETDGPIVEGQTDVLDPADPITYQTTAKFQPPLPLDKLVLLNEIQMKMQMGLESKVGALRDIGEEFPEEKLAEIRQEMRDDAQADGSLQLLQVQIQKEIVDMTGMMPGPEGTAMPMDPMMTGSGEVLGDGVPGPVGASLDPTQQQAAAIEAVEESGVRNRLVTEAFGTKMPQRRNSENKDRQ
jgi:hypothetical protein